VHQREGGVGPSGLGGRGSEQRPGRSRDALQQLFADGAGAALEQRFEALRLPALAVPVAGVQAWWLMQGEYEQAPRQWSLGLGALVPFDIES
jgi:hypothetical protein